MAGYVATLLLGRARDGGWCRAQVSSERRTIATLSLVDYEMVRSRGDWFFAVPGHEVCVVDGEEVATIVKRYAGYSLMEKIGAAGEAAARLDPRG
jgi:hypothetical protein